jgi:hypothetical protein
MNNGEFLPRKSRLLDPDGESAIIGTIPTGLFDQINESKLVPCKAFTERNHAIVYEAAYYLKKSGIPVCTGSVCDYIERNRLDMELQRLIPGSLHSWRDWPDFTDQSLALSTPRAVEHSLDGIGHKFLQREARDIASNLESGEMSPEEAMEALRELSPQVNNLPPMISAADLCKTPPPRPPEVIEGILHQGSKLALGGGPKSFKTWVLLELAISVATGREWLGFQTTRGKVLYCNFELPAFAMEERIREICATMNIEVPAALTLWNLRGHASQAATILPKIAAESKKKGFSLMFLDPVYKLLGERDENSARDMTFLMNTVERLTVETGAGVAFGSHYSKGNQAGKESMDRISGSGVFARDPDSIVTMTKHETDNAFSVEMTLRNFPPQESFVVRRKHPLMEIDGKLDPAKLKQAGGRPSSFTVEDILRHLSGSMTSSEWAKVCEEHETISERSFYRMRKQLEKEGRIFRSEIDQKWSLRP